MRYCSRATRSALDRSPSGGRVEKDAADVDEADAMFMIGACSAFVSYLVNKARSVGLLK